MEKIKISCWACKGKGIVKTPDMKGRCAEECRSCKGKGYRLIPKDSYLDDMTIFIGLKREDRVDRVFKESFGFVHIPYDTHTSVQIDKERASKKMVYFSRGGATYEDWLAGARPLPVKELYCPLVWVHGNERDPRIGDLYRARCRFGAKGGLPLKCRYWEEKALCWNLFSDTGDEYSLEDAVSRLGADLDKY